ncbi:hypothetical protein ACOSP7_023121 [Xanthoceras sorbifolium]
MLSTNKKNMDVVTDSTDKSFGVGIVVRDSQGVLICAAALFFSFFFSVEVAETRAILEGVLFASSSGLLPLVVESDALSVVSLCNGSLFSRAEADLVVQDIIAFSSKFVVSCIGFVPK